jgi:hypothetical protein
MRQSRTRSHATPLAAPSRDALGDDAPTTAAVQEVHQVALHLLCLALDECLAHRVPTCRPFHVPLGGGRR